MFSLTMKTNFSLSCKYRIEKRVSTNLQNKTDIFKIIILLSNYFKMFAFFVAKYNLSVSQFHFSKLYFQTPMPILIANQFIFYFIVSNKDSQWHTFIHRYKFASCFFSPSNQIFFLYTARVQRRKEVYTKHASTTQHKSIFRLFH